MSPTPEGKIHPAAALMPSLSDAELDQLATDILENGLVHPIVLDNDGAIVDGRSRVDACRRAGVAPRYERLPITWAHDVPGYVVSVNLQRRHLSQGQVAVLGAQLRAVSGKPLSQIARELEVSKSRVAFAATVLEFAPDLIEEVKSEGIQLNVAYLEAKKRKIAAQTPEEHPKAEAMDAPATRQEDGPPISLVVPDGRACRPRRPTGASRVSHSDLTCHQTDLTVVSKLVKQAAEAYARASEVLDARTTCCDDLSQLNIIIEVANRLVSLTRKLGQEAENLAHQLAEPKNPQPTL